MLIFCHDDRALDPWSFDDFLNFYLRFVAADYFLNLSMYAHRASVVIVELQQPISMLQTKIYCFFHILLLKSFI